MPEEVERKFKVGDKVRLNVPSIITGNSGVENGVEGTVARLGGTSTPDKGAVVVNENFMQGDDSYPEHGIWFHDHWLELVS